MTEQIRHHMLDSFMENDTMEIVEGKSDKDFRFLQSLLIKYEEDELGKLSDAQFKWLMDCHERYIGFG